MITAGLDNKTYMMDDRVGFFNTAMEEKKGEITIFQRGYTEGVIKCLDMKGCNPVDKPVQGPQEAS